MDLANLLQIKLQALQLIVGILSGYWGIVRCGFHDLFQSIFLRHALHKFFLLLDYRFRFIGRRLGLLLGLASCHHRHRTVDQLSKRHIHILLARYSLYNSTLLSSPLISRGQHQSVQIRLFPKILIITKILNWSLLLMHYHIRWRRFYRRLTGR